MNATQAPTSGSPGPIRCHGNTAQDVSGAGRGAPHIMRKTLTTLIVAAVVLLGGTATAHATGPIGGQPGGTHIGGPIGGQPGGTHIVGPYPPPKASPVVPGPVHGTHPAVKAHHQALVVQRGGWFYVMLTLR